MADYTADSTAAARHREKVVERGRRERAIQNEISPLPDVVNPKRKEACGKSLQLFCETYRANAFSLEWSNDHLKVLARFDQTARKGGLFGLAMPRGSGKTTLANTAALWSLLYGYRNWVCLIGSTTAKAQGLLKAIMTELRFNPLLAEDFPEVCTPIRHLNGSPTRARSQTFAGINTNLVWQAEQLTLATIPGARCSGGRVTVAGITGDIRGQQETLIDGRVIRPDYVILDDPQTRESARSPQQTEDRLATLNGDILGLAGPGINISGILPCTVIQRADMADRILDRELNPEWQGERTQMLYGTPKDMTLWQQYQEIREQEFRNGGDGSQCTEFYSENQEAMDEGLTAAWPQRFNENELSGIQHAMNLFFRDEPAFHAEYQNQPIDDVNDDTLDEEEIVTRINSHKRYVCDQEAEFCTAFIDVQKELLYYVVCAWKKNFTGQVIDYGAWPNQKTNNFRLTNAKRTLSKQYPGQSLEVKLKRGLQGLTDQIINQKWKSADGETELYVDRILIDANWGISRDIVYSFIRQSQHRRIIVPSHGRFVGASSEPLNARHVKKLGRRVGTHWRMDKAQDSPVRFILYDTNWWKSYTFGRLATEPGTAGSLTLYQASPRVHRTFAKHLKAEYPVPVLGRGRMVDEWKLKPSRDDNHWLDCLVGCLVAASERGANLMSRVKTVASAKNIDEEQKAPNSRKRRSVSYL